MTEATKDAGVRPAALAWIEGLAEASNKAALLTLDAAMRDGHLCFADVLEYLARREPPPPSIEDEARGLYTDDDCEIDDFPMSSKSDHGWWVSAWVHVEG